MPRIHRSLIRRAKKLDADKVANRAEDYLYGVGSYRRDLAGIGGLISPDRIRAGIKRIDSLESEIIKLEKRIDTLCMRRAVEAAKLEEELEVNLDILREYLDAEELKDFY